MKFYKGSMEYCYLYDILIKGKDTTANVENLRHVLQRLEKCEVRLTKKKCAFFTIAWSTLYMLIDAEGVRPIKEITEATDKAPVPTNMSELRYFLAMLNYYGKYILNLKLSQWLICCIKKSCVELV